MNWRYAQATYNPDGIIAIAMNPNNGEILAMSSRPDFDPANFQRCSIQRFIIVIYQYGVRMSQARRLKLLHLLRHLKKKRLIYKRHILLIQDLLKWLDARLRCWKRGGHGDQTFLEVVQNSCNPGFVELGERLGKETLFKYIKELWFW